MKNLSLKLLVSLIGFAVVIITVMSLTTRYLLLQDIVEQQEAVRADIENNIVSDLETMDNAHMIFQKIETEEMEKGLQELSNFYDENPDVLSWNLNEIKEKYGPLDFYVLNADGQVVVTTHEPSINMDFNECCSGFVKVIKERIETNQFYFDGLEISVAANDQRMYGYLPTKDNEYLLEFGVRFEDTHVAKEFNYEKTVESLINNQMDLEDLRILTYDGFMLNNAPGMLSYEDLDVDLQQAFLEASDAGKDITISKELQDGLKETHRFISYQAEDATGVQTKRIIYAKYNNMSEMVLKQNNSTQFVIMLGVGIMTSIILLFFILQLLNNTISLATYDTLTGAYNRASYLQYMDGLISNRQQYPIGLILVDLDNFKQVNDVYGHAEGDAVLMEITKILMKVTGTEGYVVRFGGDEFAIVFEKADAYILKHYANLLLEEVRERRVKESGNSWATLSLSIGGTIQQEPAEEEARLFERADRALYISKERGKDGYTYLVPSKPTRDVVVSKLI